MDTYLGGRMEHTNKSDIEKQIVEIEEWLKQELWLYDDEDWSTSRSKVEEYMELLIEQLKACREEMDWRKRFYANEEIAIASFKRIIEQRMKEACFEAGWKWIQKHINYSGLQQDKKSFEQAIDSVED